MERLSAFLYNVNGVKRYGAINFQRQKGGNKQDFINAIGLYEDTNLTPAEIEAMKA